jgi:DNA-binding response OmpR family regulator
MKKQTFSILIIEDNEWLAESYKRTLEAEGYRVYICNHAIAAIEAIDDFKPDAIILDMLLTGSTALVLMHELQSYEDTSRIPIILCTNLASDLKFDDLRSYGVRKIIDKTTMHPGDLPAAIRSVL